MGFRKSCVGEKSNVITCRSPSQSDAPHTLKIVFDFLLDYYSVWDPNLFFIRQNRQTIFSLMRIFGVVRIFGVITVLVALALAFVGGVMTEEAVGSDWGEYEPKWQYACWDKADGHLSEAHTPTGFCVRSEHRCKEIAGPIAGPSDGHCVVMDGWCVKIKSRIDPSPSVRCRPVAEGELNALANGHKSSTEWLYACFDQGGKVIPHLKPDGFCSTRNNNATNQDAYTNQDASGATNQDASGATNRDASTCVPHECGENGSTCVAVSDRVCSCVATDTYSSTQPQASCFHLSATELAAIVRGWPPRF